MSPLSHLRKRLALDTRTRHSSRPLSTAAAIAGLVLLPVLALAQSLDATIENILSGAQLPSMRIGVHVVDQDGYELADFEQGVAPGLSPGYIPASNMKLFTSGTALLTLGPDFAFQTKVFLDRTRVIVLADGDPALADPELLSEQGLGAADFIKHIVNAVQETGVREITEVIVDDRIFDRDYVHDDWPADQLNRWYCAQVCGLNFHANVLRVYAAPAGRPGLQGLVSFEPDAPWLTQINKTRTTDEGSTSIWAARPPEENSFTIYGSVKQALLKPIEVTVHEPSTVFARLLSDALLDAGLKNGDIPAVWRLALSDEEFDYDTYQTVAVIKTDMDTILERCNTDSHNLYAESLLKRFGSQQTNQSGSWLNGAAVMRMQVSGQLGPEHVINLFVADGSGMSRNNKVTPELVTSWLVALGNSSQVADSFIGSLATVGQGTLRNRFRKDEPANEIRAKSGYIRGVRTLSGYVLNPTDHSQYVAFSILVNEIPPNASHQRVKLLHEQIVMAIDEWMSKRASPDRPGVAGVPIDE